MHDAVCIFFAMVRNRTSAFDVNAKLAAELKNLLERILRDPAASLPSEYITRATRLGVPVADL